MITPSPARQLFSQTWPMLFGVLSLMSFQLVDSAFIGQLGVLPLAAQGFTQPIQMVIIGLQVGLGIATTAVISRALGENKIRYAQQLGGLVVMIGAVGIAFFSVIIYGLRNPILDLLGAPDTIHPIIQSYWVYWLLSTWCGALLYFLYSLCRANGNTMLPGIMMMVTSLLNIALDPIFIFTFNMGINGAAMATLISFSIGIVVVAPTVFRKHWMSFDWHDLSVPKSIASLTSIMGPAMISQLLPPVSSMLATKLLASFGTTAVAAWAIGSRYEFFAIVAVLALTMSMPPMVGRLLGAKQFDQIEKLISIAIRFILIFQFAIALLTFFGASFLSNLMTSDKDVTAILHWHLTLVPISLGTLGICMLMVSLSNAIGQSYYALLISALRLFIFFLPCLWLGAKLGGIKGLFIGALIGNILAGLNAWWIFKKNFTRLTQKSTG
ncbi:MATE family efflux transporter [Vibrio rumoiensis]|uniref:Multidrug resistance protein NorM n=1 Tax=Vibrio rumoiensis 1S-45 TaxID=1188252 RepID=A0A1E5E6B0_9VIBR|nr:MATE family efflux transporter [Vibrio rumoiensis]OEF30037.1 MATE family efflux transporter [Vibrio rumoiensis 1S-45]